MKNNELIWSLLLHFGRNLWSDREEFGFSDKLEFDEKTWRETIDYAAECGVNAIVMDVADAVRYKSHPEIAVSDAWTPEKLKAEVKRIKAMGIDVYPKLNFATTHDAWLRKYSRMVSTPVYYEVCKDLIEEIVEIFDQPKYVHLGMDEEWNTCTTVDFDCARRGKLFWHDLNFLFDCVREQNSIPWIWADPYWYFKDEFLVEVKKDVIISPWYYDTFSDDFLGIDKRYTIPEMRTSLTELAQDGFTVVPCSSNWASASHIDGLLKYCKENTEASKLIGYMMAPWAPTTEQYKYTLFEGIQQLKNAKEKHYFEK